VREFSYKRSNTPRWKKYVTVVSLNNESGTKVAKLARYFEISQQRRWLRFWKIKTIIYLLGVHDGVLRGLGAPAFAGQVQEPALLCGRRPNLLRGVEPKKKEPISSKIKKDTDVPKLIANIALRTLGLKQLLHYDVTSYCCETLARCDGQLTFTIS